MKKIDHHYTESGLKNVVISGIPVEVDDDGDEIITIPAINELHHVIALGIVSHPKGISGDELRFLRTEMGLTQAELASMVHRDKQSIGRWERGEIDIDSPVEAIIRRMAIEKLNLPADVGMDELSRWSIPTAEPQLISVEKVESASEPYVLVAAA
ncbi:helix-turn-helix domain-containing protein [Rhizobium sp. CNPSo 3968]|uniref:helix-turn-helix domain-containing protein n=1 Tax=Rhizobium sp. CNPSo 3968 TaxID=3021408 RepID=UPI00254B633F|nr:helix-turn-helix domain-containing protein [Rhizobium sp. CNPSo 3968]MDK4723389.1 helix-turn-helix domain-containing protein [Rhizobium sp. CNPSo 3968]